MKQYQLIKSGRGKSWVISYFVDGVYVMEPGGVPIWHGDNARTARQSDENKVREHLFRLHELGWAAKDARTKAHVDKLLGRSTN